MKRPRWAFALRLAAAVLVTPFVPPLMLVAATRGAMDFGTTAYIYGLFGLAAVLVLGLPLLFLLMRLGWTGFGTFAAGGGVCAAITAYAMLYRSHEMGMVVFFAVSGVLAGALFRLILFGYASP